MGTQVRITSPPPKMIEKPLYIVVFLYVDTAYRIAMLNITSASIWDIDSATLGKVLSPFSIAISASKSSVLDKQTEKMKHLMNDINAFNFGNKREEALEALAVWLPQAERFLAQTKSSQDYIDQLTDRNSELTQELMSKDERYSELSMEAAYMRHTLNSQQRLIDTFPKEVLDEIKQKKGIGKVR